jgi:Sel1 repeat
LTGTPAGDLHVLVGTQFVVDETLRWPGGGWSRRLPLKVTLTCEGEKRVEADRNQAAEGKSTGAHSAPFDIVGSPPRLSWSEHRDIVCPIRDDGDLHLTLTFDDNSSGYENCRSSGRNTPCRSLAQFNTKDTAQATEISRKRCDRDDALACTNLADTYAPQDAAHAVELYEKGCKGGDLRGCIDLGKLYEEGGQGVARDFERARKLYARACEEGAARGCSGLGDLYAKRDGEDLVQAAALYEKGCRRGDSYGCSKTDKARLQGPVRRAIGYSSRGL